MHQNIIPEEFHSFETDEPFTHCCDCDCELVSSGQMYMVQKTFDKSECVMEFALCTTCKGKLDEQLSEKSKEALFDFMHEHVEMVEAPADYGEEDAMKQIDECLACGAERSKCKGHSYSGLFLGSTLVPGPFPMMICGKCHELMSEGLSEHTKDVRDKFYEENFPGPPSELNLPNGKPVLM